MKARVTIKIGDADLDIYGDYTPEEPEILRKDGTGTPRSPSDFEIQEVWLDDIIITGLFSWLDHHIHKEDIWGILTDITIREYEKGRG